MPSTLSAANLATLTPSPWSRKDQYVGSLFASIEPNVPWSIDDFRSELLAVTSFAYHDVKANLCLIAVHHTPNL
jgi:hypothetical protein